MVLNGESHPNVGASLPLSAFPTCRKIYLVGKVPNPGLHPAPLPQPSFHRDGIRRGAGGNLFVPSARYLPSPVFSVFFTFLRSYQPASQPATRVCVCVDADIYMYVRRYSWLTLSYSYISAWILSFSRYTATYTYAPTHTLMSYYVTPYTAM